MNLRRLSRILPLLLLLALPAIPALAGDPDVAQLLFEKGEKCYRAKDYAEAESYYRRALEEYSPLPDAAYSLGESLEKLKRAEEAIDAYLLCKDQLKGMDSLDRNQKRLLDKAEKAIKRLGVGYAELADIDRDFVKDCLAFGRKFFHSDPGWARKAFEHAIKLDPTNKLVQGYLDRLSDVSGPTVGTGVFEPLIKGDSLKGWVPGNCSTWSCKGGIITARVSGGPGQANRLAEFFDGDYTLTGKFRMVRKADEQPTFGLMFGMKKDRANHGLFIVSFFNEFTLTRFERGGHEDVRTRVLTKFDYFDWHEIRVEVSPGRAVCFLDGKEVFTYGGEDPTMFEGPAGLFVQDADVEIKELGVKR